MSAEWDATILLSGIYALVAMATQLGMACGAFSLASVGWMAVGAYGAGLSATKWHLSAPVGLIVMLAVGLVVGPVVMLPVRRISGLYFALVSLSFVLVIQAVATNWNYVGGSQGMFGVPLDTTQTKVWVGVAITAGIALVLTTGRFGRALRAAGQDAKVANSLGVRVLRIQLAVGALSAMIGVLAGCLYAGYIGSVDPTQFGFATVVQILVMVIIGGRGGWLGPILGALLITSLPLLFRPIAGYSAIANGVLLVGVAVGFPGGLMELVNRLMALVRRALRTSRGVEGTELRINRIEREDEEHPVDPLVSGGLNAARSN